MRVVQVNAVNGIGSTGRSVSELATGLERLGIESPVAYSSGLPREGGFVIGSPLEKRLHALGSRLTGRQAYFSRRGTADLLRFLDEKPPELVHLHNLHSNFIHLPRLLEYLGDKDVPTVVTLDDCWHYTGKCCHYTVDGCSRWQTGCGSCPRLHQDNPSWFIDASAAMWADKKRLYSRIPRLGVIGVSDWITHEAQRSLLASARIMRRIYNWVDLSVFNPLMEDSGDTRPWDQDEFVVMGVASKWSDAKGLGDILKVTQALRDVPVPDPNSGADRKIRKVRVVLVGVMDGRRTLPDDITVVGPTDSIHRLAHYYRSADVFLQLSREETFGKVVAEALACGTPIIAYDATANSELVGPGCGYVVKPGSIHGVVQCVQKVMDLTREHFSESCRAYAVGNFDKDSRIQDHVDLYRDLCAL